MATVALVGADGSGKTTISRRLVEESSVPIKYLYMGPNIESSNVALPWSRLVLRIKLASYRREAKQKGITDPTFVSTHHALHRSVKRGPVFRTLRMLNRLTEGLYRQILSWTYQLRGYVVLYDRHFLFDSASAKKHDQWSDRIYNWILTHLIPKPNLVLFLDAPAELLFARSGEGTVDYLERKRRAIVKAHDSVPRFVRIDVDRPVEDVLNDVNRHIQTLAGDGKARPSS